MENNDKGKCLTSNYFVKLLKIVSGSYTGGLNENHIN